MSQSAEFIFWFLNMIINILLTILWWLFLTILLYFLTTYIQHLCSLHKYPKGPFPLPILGNLLNLTDRPYLDFTKLAKIYGDVFSMSFGMDRIVVINSLENIKEALIKKGMVSSFLIKSLFRR